MLLSVSAGRGSSADLRARLAMDEEEQRRILRSSRAVLPELVVLCTCHRTEVYAASSPTSDALREVSALLPRLRHADQDELVVREGLAAVEHVFRVAGGLDSPVLGERQVLGQLRRAYLLAREEGSAGQVLSRVFERGIAAGRRVRAETPLGRLGKTIGSVVAGYLDRNLGLAGRRGVIVGAGNLAAEVAGHLSKKGARLSIANRTLEQARRLAADVDGTAHPLDDLIPLIAGSEFAVVAVSGGTMLHSRQLSRSDGGRPLLVVDLSFPLAVEASGADGVRVVGLEELPVPPQPELRGAAEAAEGIIREEVDEIGRWFEGRSSAAAIRELRDRADALVRDEVERAISGMDLAPGEIRRVEVLAARITNKLLHAPTSALADGDGETRRVLTRALGLGS